MTPKPAATQGPAPLHRVTADVTQRRLLVPRPGLRFVKNTLNFETTFRYHTYFGDEEGHPGSVVTFLEFNEAPPGRPGRATSFASSCGSRLTTRSSTGWTADRQPDPLRDAAAGPDAARALVFRDPEGHDVELMVSDSPDEPLTAEADDIPAEHRILGIEGPRSFATLEETLPFAQHIGFRQDGDRLVLDGSKGQGRWYFARRPPAGDMHVGVWHHIALGAGSRDELQAWRDYARHGPAPYTAIFDHYFFDSCYSMSPGGRVELCTADPGFTLDEKLEDLGDRLSLSPRTEPLRAKLEAELGDRQPAPAREGG